MYKATMRCILSVVLLTGMLSIAGCQTINYYGQSIRGQWQVFHRAKPIDEWLNSSTTSSELKQKLIKIKQIRRFASQQLQLPQNKSYTLYADIKRPYVVWNIFAAPKLSLEPYTWCYPVIGCQAYRGYFSKQPAINVARQIEARGYDVSVGGVKAYSTLGWFNDPILNTFVNYSETNLASLIFHELSHQIVYVKGDTVFNESFATLVENKGIEVWLRHNNRDDELSRYKKSQQLEKKVLLLVSNYKNKLEQRYTSEVDEQTKYLHKKRIFAQLKQEYQRIKQDFQFSSAWDNWFGQDLNNAHLVAIGTYYDKVGEFEKLFVNSDRDFSIFFAAIKKLAKLDKPQRDAFLANLDSP